MRHPLRRARGFALVLAVFIIVILASIGAYLLSESNTQIAASALDEQGARAYQASRTGLEWGAYQILQAPAGAFAIACAAASLASPTSTTMALPQISPGAAVSFSATVTCGSPGVETEGGVSVRTYLVRSTGCNAASCPSAAPGPNYAERQLQLTVAN
ncbi:MAG: agglutinin biogenesis protein MshP [Burkholderiales bacterium]